MSRLSRLFASGPSLRFASIAVATAMLLSLLALPGSARAQGLFQSPSPTLTTGTTPQGVAAADLNRDGFMDLVVTDSASKNVKIFLATGPNTYAAASTLPTCTDPTAVIAKDFNGDGYPDIAVACTSNNFVELFLNDGTGNFGSASVTESITKPVAMFAGDFTGNGLVDLAAISGTGGVTVYLDIAGSVVVKTTTLTGTLTGIVAGDFNHDGKLDIAVSDSANNNVHVLAGNGDGTFTAIGSYSTGAGTAPSGIVAADFNNDGNLDVATGNAGNNTATVLLGSPTGALTLQAAQATGTNPIALVTADVNSDGNPDVVAFDSPTATTGEVDVLLGNGDGTLQVPQAASESFKPGTLAAVADFNRDGKPDIALAQQNTNQATVLLNNTLPTQYPDGRSFAAEHNLLNGYGNFADSVAVGDFNKDGLLDIAVSYLQDNSVRVLLNNGSGASNFNPATVYAVGKQPYWIASGDLNGDGYPDLVTANTTDGTVSVLLNNGPSGNGTFAAAATYTVGKQPYQVAIGDVNGDGYPDLAVANYSANSVTVLFGSKVGTFTVQPTALATCANPYGVAIGDFKHNGFPSIAVTCYSAAATGLEVFPNNGNGTFGAPFMTATNTHPSSLVVGDFNRDGKLDIVVGNTSANNISFFAGNGDNTFAAGVTSPSLNFPDSIAAGDFNGDGILDIAGVAPNFNAVEVTLGKGDGTFGTFQQRSAGQFTVRTQPWALAVGDFNNDGQLDIVTANTFHQVNIASPAYQARYLGQYPANPAGNPSIAVLTNASAAVVSLSVAPPNNTFPLADNNTGVVIQATAQPAYSGGTPTGSVIFENSAGSVLGTGPYTLNGGGVASYPVGHLGSGSYVFTSLYSGDSSFQPTTGSGAAFAVTVAGTPVTLTLSPASVPYGTAFTANVTVTGTAGLGIPTGTLAIYSSTGFTLGNVTLAASGNNSAGTATFTATAPNLNIGSYNFYAVYNPTNVNYQQGTSSYAPLTVTPLATTTALSCTFGFGGTPCTATVTVASTGLPVPAGNTVDFTVSGVSGVVAATTNASGQATYTYSEFIGLFTITANFPTQSNYLTSTSPGVTGGCFLFFCLDRRHQGGPFTSFNIFGLNAASRNRTIPFRLY
ncbi:MAG: FG-GAP-like repeat-containing protein [Acidobacteriaceae bacterium]